MASSDFLRLYRELCRIDPYSTKKVYDSTYERERKDIMHALGHEVGGVEKKMEALKYHGILL